MTTFIGRINGGEELVIETRSTSWRLALGGLFVHVTDKQLESEQALVLEIMCPEVVELGWYRYTIRIDLERRMLIEEGERLRTPSDKSLRASLAAKHERSGGKDQHLRV